jgi:SAM-dependent methyltransferase
MRYYCEYSADNVNHVSPSVAIVAEELEKEGRAPRNILDLGCGNGRNSLYLARKFPCSVVLLDIDDKMLSWADGLFKANGLANIVTVFSAIEDIAGNPSMLSKIGHEKFDVVILSYVLQHIEPVYHPLILDFCKKICSGYLVIDIFWNPCRVGQGEFQQIGSVTWYGLTYEELVTMLSPNFSIIEDRFLKTDISVLINLVLKAGQTTLDRFLNRNPEYYSDRVRRRRSYGNITRTPRRVFNIDEMECVKFLTSLYPSEFDLVRTELIQWIQNSGRVPSSMLAAKFLWLCRIIKIPVMLKEVSRDFGISTRKLIEMMSGTNYVPALSPEDFIERIGRQLSLSDTIRNRARAYVGGSLEGSSPTVRACCAVLKAARTESVQVSKSEIASALDVSAVAINLALKKESSVLKEPLKPIP